MIRFELCGARPSHSVPVARRNWGGVAHLPWQLVRLTLLPTVLTALSAPALAQDPAGTPGAKTNATTANSTPSAVAPAQAPTPGTEAGPPAAFGAPPAATAAPAALLAATAAQPAATEGPAAQTPEAQRQAFPNDPTVPAQIPGIGAIPAQAPQTPVAAPSDPNPPVTQPVPPDSLLGVGLVPHHYDDVGYPESYEGLLVVELDPQVGPITMVQGTRPHYLEAQFVNVQRDAVWLARKAAIVDVLPSGASYEIPYGYGAVKRSLSAVTLVEAQVQPHFSDNQKSYETFPLEDTYIGAVASLVGVRAELRYVEKERYVGFAQAGLNLAGMAGIEFNRTYGAFAVPVVLGGGLRYPSLINAVGTNWTTGAEVILGLGDIDDDSATASAIALPGLFHEVEWAFRRDVEVKDFRTDPRPYNYGVQSLFAKIGAYPDFLGGATKSILFDIHIGYRYNFQGPKIPEHKFKETKITYASERYVQRKLEEEKRRQELEELLKRRQEQQPGMTQPYPTYPPAAETTAAPTSSYPVGGAPPPGAPTTPTPYPPIQPATPTQTPSQGTY